jgi:hypothetical protein
MMRWKAPVSEMPAPEQAFLGAGTLLIAAMAAWRKLTSRLPSH